MTIVFNVEFPEHSSRTISGHPISGPGWEPAAQAGRGRIQDRGAAQPPDPVGQALRDSHCG